MSDIFVSYAKEDCDIVARFVDVLCARQWTVFWDREIEPGQRWRDVLKTELAGASCVVVLWSRASVESRWVCEEAEEATNRGVMVPVWIEDVDPPFGFKSVQAADLSAWDGSYPAPELDRLLAAIASRLGQPRPSTAGHAAVTRKLRQPLRIRLHARIPYGHLHSVDRGEQSRLLREALDGLPTAGPCKPRVFLVSGAIEENAEELVPYVAHTVLSKYGLSAGSSDSRDFPWLVWSSPETGAVDARFQELLSSLGSVIDTTSREPKGIVAALNDPANVSVMGSIVYASTLDRPEAELIDRWLLFWNELGRTDLQRPIVVFLCLVYDEGPDRGRAMVEQFMAGRTWRTLPGVLVHPLPELPEIQREPDVQMWGKRVLRSVCRVERRDLARTTSTLCELMPAASFTWESFHLTLEDHDLVQPAD